MSDGFRMKGEFCFYIRTFLHPHQNYIFFSNHPVPFVSPLLPLSLSLSHPISPSVCLSHSLSFHLYLSLISISPFLISPFLSLSPFSSLLNLLYYSRFRYFSPIGPSLIRLSTPSLPIMFLISHPSFFPLVFPFSSKKYLVY